MAIVVKLDDLLHDRRMTLTELADRIDITLANFSTLEAICKALSCQPGDMIQFEPEQGEGNRENLK